MNIYEFIKCSPDGIVVIDKQGKIVLTNPLFFEITGLDNKITNAIDNDFWNDLFDLFYSKDKFDLNNICEFKSTELIIESKNSHKKVKLFFRLISENKNFKQIIFFRDASDMDTLSPLTKDLLNNLSHDLSTPLTIIHGFTELLLLKKYDSHTHQEVIKTIQNQAKNLTSTINKFVSFWSH